MSRRPDVVIGSGSPATIRPTIERRTRVVAAGAVAVTAALGVGTLAWIVFGSSGELSRRDAVADAIIAIVATMFAIAGSWILRRIGNRVGLVFAAAGVGAGIVALSDAVLKGMTGSPAPGWLAWFALLAILGPLLAGSALSVLFLIFPTGATPSRRWRWVVRLWVVGVICAVVATLAAPGPISGEIPGLVNPLGIPGLRLLTTFLARAGGGALLAVVLLGVASLVIRARGAGPEVRAQVRWLGFAGSVAVVFFLLSGPGAGNAAIANVSWLLFLATLMLGIPGAVAIAVLRYRLYEIDVVLSKALIFGGLAVFITVVYVAVVVGIGSLFGDPSNPSLAIVGTIAVALLFAPARARVRRAANRFVYGERATPYEVMAGFSRRVGDTISVEEVLPGMAEAAASGVGALAVRVRVQTGERERAERWPADADEPSSWSRTLEVLYRGEVVGGLDIAKVPGDVLSPAEDHLLEELASHAGLALHNVALTDELDVRARELAEQSASLAESRERLVRARDQQRKRLEREIREGPASRLMTIRDRLDLAEELASTDPGAAADLLDELGAISNQTLEQLRDLARGIFPPLLVDKGVVPALEAHVRKVEANVTVGASPSFASRRFDPDTEACIYFCCLQAIQNVLRHAGNAPTTVHLQTDAEGVAFTIRDEGPGFDVHAATEGAGQAIIRDRIEALDGTLSVRSQRGRGTTVEGRLPLQRVLA